ncbi:pericentrin [Tamandua tetradactyla]|uniref:pericentrin n=1 Tax=Tamandua tetradactyla TaxID=48850 RepID=UPI004054457E
MEEDDQEQRRRKVEAGRAKLAHFRQRKTKGDCTHSKKKTAKRKGTVVDAPVQEENPLAAEDRGLPGGGDVWKSASCSNTPGRAEGAFAAQEHELEMAKLSSSHQDEVERLQAELGGREQQATAHQVDMQPMVPPTQAAHSLELEALRLSLNNMHTAQLELTQANLQKEKETALTELREMLNSRRAQELALLQSRQQCELEVLKEQHAQEKEEIVLKWGQETAELKEKLESEMEKNAQMLETLTRDWELEREFCLENLRKELSEKHQSEMENLQNQFKNDLAEQKAELEKIFQAKNEAEFTLRNLETQHEAAIQKLREELQAEHCQYIEDMEVKFKEKEKEKQLELERLQASYQELKAQSQEEIKLLWSQLDSARPSRQDLSELHEQLRARVPACVELERVTQACEQQLQQEETECETELEHLRVCFEKKLRDAERNYQEDSTLLEQRLQEGKEDSFLTFAEISSSAVLEETSEKERKGYLDQLNFQLEQHKEGLTRLQVPLAEKPMCDLVALQSALGSWCEEGVAIPTEASAAPHTEAGLLWTAQGLALKQLCASLTEGHDRELAQMRLQYAQEAAFKVEMEVAARILSLENEHKVKLSLLQTEFKEEIEPLKLENRNLHEKLQHEIHLKEGLEKVNRNLVEDHQDKLKKTEEKIQLMKQEFKEKEDEWKVTSEDLERKAEEKLALLALELREKAESEKQSIINKFELRETAMRELQGQQAAQIQALEKSLTEQRGRLQQLELGLPGDEPLQCSCCGQELGGVASPMAQGWGLATRGVQEDRALPLMLAQSRFLEERKEITEKFSAEQDALMQELQEKHAAELRRVQEEHQRHVASLVTELQVKHQAEVKGLQAALLGEQRTLLETHAAALQTQHAAEVSALQTRHLSSLDSLESSYQAEVQALQQEHRQALERLQVDLEEQLQKKDDFHQMILTQELEKLKLKQGEELQHTKDSLKIAMSTQHIASLKAMASELRAAYQSEFESAKKAALHEKEELHKLESEKARSVFQKEKASLSLQLQEKENQIQQLKDHILSLSNEIRECRSELEKLQQRHKRENEEGANLISMLKSDVDLSHSERKALQEALHRLLSLFGETLKAALAIKSQISERVGLCLDGDVGAADPESQPGVQLEPKSPSTARPLDETWPRFDSVPLDFYQLWPECAEAASVTDVSSHVRESFFLSPETTLECEQPIRRVYQSLGLAVDSLLEMALGATKQLEEARQIHSHFEKEFNYKNEETAQVIKKQEELLECLNEESAAKAKLTLELHKAEGIIEGFKVEKASLQEALGQKEKSEERLVLELENCKEQLRLATLEQVQLKEACAVLQKQKNMLAAEAEEKEVGIPVIAERKDSGLRKEVKRVTEEHLETRRQAEKDRSALLAQLRVLEAELEEQLHQHQGCAWHAEEALGLERQLASLDKLLRHQRQFMDEQAAEREHERDEFQQEIQRLEEQLRQAVRPQPCGPPDGTSALLSEEVELLQEKLRKKSDEFNELVIKKELAERQLITQEEEMARLEETNADARRTVIQLQEELEKQKKMEKEFQDKEVVKAQQMNSSTLVSTLQSARDEARHLAEGPGVQEGLSRHQGELLDLKEQLENTEDNLGSRIGESRHLNLELDKQSSHPAVSIRELQEENASLKAFLQNKEKEITSMQEQLEAQPGGLGGPAPHEVMYNRSSEIEELKLIIENLQENQVRLQKDRAEEIEQLYEVIEKLQKELSLAGPQLHEVSDSQLESLESELQQGPCCCRGASPGDPRLRALEQELAAALGAQEGLQQSLRAAKEAAERQLAVLRCTLALRESEVESMASRIRAFEATLQEKETALAERDLEIDALSRRRAAPPTQLDAVQPAWPLGPAVQHAFPAHQLQVLRCPEGGVSGGLGDTCGHGLDQDLGSSLPTMDPQDLPSLNMDDLQPAKGLVSLRDAGFQNQETVTSTLTACEKQIECELLLVRTEMPLCAEDSSHAVEHTQGEEALKDCPLQKVDLTTQVKRFQEQLNLLVCSVTTRGTGTEDFRCQQPSAQPLENSSRNSSPDAEQMDGPPPAAGFISSQNTWDLLKLFKTQDPLIGNEMSDFLVQEKAELPEGSLSLKASLPGSSQDLNSEMTEPFQMQVRTMDLSSWSPPEVVRKDSTLELLPSLPLTPCSDAASLRGLDASPVPGDGPGLLCDPDMSTVEKSLQWAGPHSADPQHVGKMPVEKDVEEFIITSFDSQESVRSPPLAVEGKSDGIEKRTTELLSPSSGSVEPPSALGAAAPEGGRGPPPAAMREEVQPRQVKALLKMVWDESHHILALSEVRGPPSVLPEPFLHGAAPALRKQLAPAPQEEEKASSDMCLDWKGESLQTMHDALGKEGSLLQGGFQAVLCGSQPGGHGALLERLEKAVCEQGELPEKSLECLCLSDRSSLLSEVQALRAQLRLTHLQNQEKLQQLCTALTSAEAHGSRQEHQLRRQAELLAYKVEQEKCIASDLQKTLSEEQEKAATVRKLLVTEQNAVKDLKSELCECKQENERLLESLRNVQKEVFQLRTMLDSQEKDLRAALQELESECAKERTLQSRLEQEQLQQQQQQAQSAKTLEELRASLEKQRAHSDQLCVALKHEQAAKDNLQKELQIEQSRCEALLAQGRSRLAELQRGVEAERSHALELAEALQHERLLTEQLSRRVPEAHAPHEPQRHHATLRKLKEERARVAELQAMLEKAQQQAVCSAQQLEAEVQARCEELRKEKEVSAKLKLRVEALQNQKQELRCYLEKERERPARLQAELEQLWSRCKERDGPEQTRKTLETRQSHADAEGRTEWQRDKEKLRELELQRQRDEHKIQQLQQTVRELGAMEAAHGADPLQAQQEELEKIRQQLLRAAGFLTNFITQTVDRTINDWTSSNEKAVTSLLRTLEELKSELSMSASSQKKMAAELQIQLVDVLLKDNESLTKALGTVAREKAELCKATSKLEKTLKHHLHKGCTLSRLARPAWRGRTAPQSSPGHTESGLPVPAASEEASVHAAKMEKLYLHYLRAESFRKALIYQKKYLLLLIGGFQDSEQETLSMIAHLGVFPSKADKKVAAPRPLTKFRTAVRVVVAVLRLRFLVKKWQEVDRKGALMQGKAPCPGAPGRQQRSPPMRRVTPATGPPAGLSGDPTATASPRRRDRSHPSPNSRSERSLTASQDPEHSLTEYIHHLEMIQQRLGGMPPDSTSKESGHQKIKH